MTPQQKRGQMACVMAVDRALLDLELAVIVTGVGLNQVKSLSAILRQMIYDTSVATTTPVEPPVRPRSREDQDRARGVMRPPKYRGD